MAEGVERMVRFHMEPADLYRAQKLNFRILLFSRSFMMMLARVWLLSMLAYGGLLYLQSGWDEVFSVLIWFAPLFLVVLWCTPWVVMAFLSWRTARRTTRGPQPDPIVITVAWDETAISWNSTAGEAKTRWEDFVKAGQDEYFILLFESDALYRIIPKRVLSAAQQVDLNTLSAGIRPR